MILEAAPDQSDARGHQRRGQSVAGEALEALAVEGEGDGPLAVDAPALGQAPGQRAGHRGVVFQGEPVAGRAGGTDLIGRGIALQHQPLPAAQHMLPIFAMRTLGIVEQEDMVVPGLQIAGAIGGPRLAGVAAIAEFGVVALAAAGASDPEHRYCFQVQLPLPWSSSSPPFSKRSRAIAAVQLMLLVLGHGMGEGPARRRATALKP